jgi:cytochrome P450
MRKALKPIALTSTTGALLILPRGTICVVPQSATHTDAAHYANPHTFEPWRFTELRAAREGTDGEKASGLKHQFVSTSTTYIAFGLGKHAWYIHSYRFSLCLVG